MARWLQRWFSSDFISLLMSMIAYTRVYRLSWALYGALTLKQKHFYWLCYRYYGRSSLPYRHRERTALIYAATPRRLLISWVAMPAPPPKLYRAAPLRTCPFTPLAWWWRRRLLIMHATPACASILMQQSMSMGWIVDISCHTMTISLAMSLPVLFPPCECAQILPRRISAYKSACFVCFQLFPLNYHNNNSRKYIKILAGSIIDTEDWSFETDSLSWENGTVMIILSIRLHAIFSHFIYEHWPHTNTIYFMYTLCFYNSRY